MRALKIWGAVSWILVLFFLGRLFLNGGLTPSDINYQNAWNDAFRLVLLLAALHAVSLTLVIRVLNPLAEEPPALPAPETKTGLWDDPRI